MRAQRFAGTVTDARQRVPLNALKTILGLSDASWRRALRDPTDPLPHLRVRVTGSDTRRGKVLVKIADAEAWLARRHSPAPSDSRALVNEIVEKARG
jgi:hypothetical protein